MFVPKATPSLTGSFSNPRRRQRTGSDESVKPPKAKRQRSVLRHDDLGNQSQDAVSEAQPRFSEYQTLAEPDGSNSIPADRASMERQIVIRGPKMADQRDNNLEDEAILSKTDFYFVSQLPNLPDQVSGIRSESFRCAFGSTHGYVLTLTPSHAIVWHSSNTRASSSTDIFTLPIPESCKDPNGAIPYGVLLSTAASGSPGLLIVVPSTGKIIYWENVSSAASIGVPRQRQNSLQGSITGLLSGEYATDILNGEPSGVIVTFSSGRVAHIAVRNSQGKPTVMANFLRHKSNYNNGGILDGIKNVLGGGFWRKDVAAARAGASHQRGQRDIIIATSTGLIEVWDTHWSSGSILKRQFDIKKDLSELLSSGATDGACVQDPVVLDIAVAANEYVYDHNLQSASEESWPLFFVIAPSRSLESNRLYVVHMILSESKTHILSIRPVDLRTIPATLYVSKPRLLVTKTGDTAFLIIGQSVVLISLASFEMSLGYSRARLPFQDSINFRSGEEYKLLGAGIDDGSPYPTCLVMVRDFGIIRLAALPRYKTENGIEGVKVTAKDKLEQAVFYGFMQGNPLDLVSQPGLDFPVDEIENAALEICRQLLHSKSKFIPSTSIPLDQNLRFRAKAMDDLAFLLMQQSNSLGHKVWWELLWSAEKVAAQRAIWKIEEGYKRKDRKEKTFLTHVIGLMTDKFKTKSGPQGDVNEHVRHWFLYDTYRMEHIIPWIFNTIKAQKGNPTRQGRRMSNQLLEASELSLSILETAFQYRDGNASRYGLGDGSFEDGVLIAGYENLPEFWTSQRMGYIEAGNLLDLQLDSCRVWVHEVGTTSETPDNEIVRKLARNSAKQIRVLSQMNRERVRWLVAQGDSKSMDESISIEQAHIRQRKWQLFKLAGIGQLWDAIDLAEKFRDMTVLVELTIELQDQTKSQKKARDIADGKAEQIDQKFSYYFENFGEPWADAFFTRQISMGQSGILLAMRNFQPFVTRFLRKVPAYSRLSWINDVIGERDYNAAAEALRNMAVENESDIWCHHVEISLAKLTRLASYEKGAVADISSRDDLKLFEDYAEIDSVQEVIYAHILPVLQGAIDQKAEIDLAIDHFGGMIAEDRPSLHEVLGDALAGVVGRQVISPDQLVDLLTLIDLTQLPNYSESELCGREFLLAFRIIQLNRHYLRDAVHTSALKKLIWRRCMIRDNWEARGKVAEEPGREAEILLHDTTLFRTLTLCLTEQHNEKNSRSSLYVPSSVSELLLSKSDSDYLVSRFRPEQQPQIARDLEKENEILCEYMEGGKLEFWFKQLLASAQGVVLLPDTSSVIEPPGSDK